MKKKVLFSLLSLMFLLVLVSGCGNDGNGSGEEKQLIKVREYISEQKYDKAKDELKKRRFYD
ncbi:hypothetical protein NE604_07980 [Anaerofustis stercorihominis]|uniref:Lipoprotein n=1 Tax=Anaerofustis stercorihominis DSM 17244 TaxID=445971 RepID=B1CB37_9FIRM|nr:hypothetical protein [Anaerofustis stercorihominis]EDS71484.1 hypothetical protein ANASTE_01186 [Anaerofustis stercorihominis DSM 17244]MCQ4795576.1 hypothetical protein [Anaerofustis stercorihominis]